MATPEFGSTQITGIVAEMRGTADKLEKVDLNEQAKNEMYWDLQDERDRLRVQVAGLEKKLEEQEMETKKQVGALEAQVQSLEKQIETLEAETKDVPKIPPRPPLRSELSRESLRDTL